MKELPSHTYRCVCGGGMHIEPFEAGRLTLCTRCNSFVIVPRQLGELAKSPDFAITTDRLSLRLATRKDWRTVHEILSDEENFEYEISVPNSLKETKAELKRCAYPRGFAKSMILKWLLTTTIDGEVIGSITVAYTAPYYSACVGIMIRKHSQGQGYGTEGMTAVCRFLLEELNVDRLLAMCDAKNERCNRLLKKAGFTQEGFSRKFYHHPKRGWIDAPSYSMTKP